LADELRASLNIEATIKPGGVGTFDVIMDGKKIFSKSKVGRFPGPGEVTKIIKGQ
jgi:predicted Rdx family selenoprotein